jgi:hypothetical protein
MTENAGLRAILSKAQITDELENTLPGWLKRQGGNRWYPAYIHILKVRRMPMCCAIVLAGGGQYEY